MIIIRIKQIRSRIGWPKDQKRTLDALGLRKINQIVEHKKVPSILGMVNKVKHLVEIIEEIIVEEEAPKEPAPKEAAPKEKKEAQEEIAEETLEEILFKDIDLSDFARPKKGDRLIKEPASYNDSSIIGRFGNKNDFMIMSGYYDVAINSLKRLKDKSIGERDSHIYPILFNFRHYLELIMKDTLRNYKLINNESIKDEENKDLHSLCKLWNKLKLYIAQTEDMNSEDIKAFETLINDYHKLDKNSTSFRYTLDISGENLNISQSQSISLDNLEIIMKKMHNFIEGINALSYAQLDSIQDTYESPDIIYP